MSVPAPPLYHLNAHVARTVRKLRLAKGLSQEELAALASVDRTYISGIERARRNITIATLERLIAHLSPSPIEFFRALSAEMLMNLPKQSLSNSAVLDLGYSHNEVSIATAAQ